jgi:hypothetical protein
MEPQGMQRQMRVFAEPVPLHHTWTSARPANERPSSSCCSPMSPAQSSPLSAPQKCSSLCGEGVLKSGVPWGKILKLLGFSTRASTVKTGHCFINPPNPRHLERQCRWGSCCLYPALCPNLSQSRPRQQENDHVRPSHTPGVLGFPFLVFLEVQHLQRKHTQHTCRWMEFHTKS